MAAAVFVRYVRKLLAASRTMQSATALLDQLMGASRNASLDERAREAEREKKRHFSDPDVCKLPVPRNQSIIASCCHQCRPPSTCAVFAVLWSW